MGDAEANAGVIASGNDDENRECFTLSQWAEYFKFKRGRDSPGEARNGLLVVAVLIATSTYQAALSPPGGLWQDDENGHKAGKTILGTNTINYGFGVFLISNTAGFFGSLLMIDILTEGFPLRLEWYFIIIALIASYDSAMISIIPKGQFSLLFTILYICLPLFIAVVSIVVRKLRFLSLRCRLRQGQGHHSRVSTPLQVIKSSGP